MKNTPRNIQALGRAVVNLFGPRFSRPRLHSSALRSKSFEAAHIKAASPEAELDFVWRAFTNLNDWVRFSDAKAASVLAADGVIAGSIATWLAGSHVGIIQNRFATAWLALIVCAAFYSAAQALKSLVPRLEPSEGSSSLVFFGHIARDHPTSGEFIAKVRNALADPDNAVAEIGRQVWENSKVASAKYAHVTNALRGLAVVIYLGFGGVVIEAVVHIAGGTNGK